MAHLQGFLPPYINGRFVEQSKPDSIFYTRNPMKPNDVLASAGWNKGLLEPLISGMKSKQRGYSLVPLEDRIKLINKLIGHLRSNADEIKSNMMLELSRSRITVENEWSLCEQLFSFLPNYCRMHLEKKNDETGFEWYYAPLGFILISANVSLPMYSLLSSALPALIAGNAVCIRPSSHSMLS
ncbi:MAG: aldehyde dehydrogenase family protein, partial [Silvanigrellaceae bacterium]|nr:aldehyde dehydrogenase family protein [Silvanigrellaceae bacterium]